MDLNPTIEHEITKTRPCLVISPDEMNHAIGTVIIAPMTTKSHAYPTRIELEFAGNEDGSSSIRLERWIKVD